MPTVRTKWCLDVVIDEDSNHEFVKTAEKFRNACFGALDGLTIQTQTKIKSLVEELVGLPTDSCILKKHFHEQQAFLFESMRAFANRRAGSPHFDETSRIFRAASQGVLSAAANCWDSRSSRMTRKRKR